MFGALLVLWQFALAGPPEKPGNPGLPGCLAEVADLQVQIADLEAEIEELKNKAFVPQTGQTTCFDFNENNKVIEIECTDTGQDGDIKAGVEWPSPRFEDNGDGTVTDHLTGLVWLKNANCFDKRTWFEALEDSNTLMNGECGLSDDSEEGDWYLPNVRQLHSLIDYGTTRPAITDGHPFDDIPPFSEEQDPVYWTSSNQDVVNSASVWTVNIRSGSVRNPYNRTKNFYVWPVRGGN